MWSWRVVYFVSLKCALCWTNPGICLYLGSMSLKKATAESNQARKVFIMLQKKPETNPTRINPGNNVIGPFLITSGTGNTLDAIESLRCTHMGLQGKAALIDVHLLHPGRKDANFRGKVISVKPINGIWLTYLTEDFNEPRSRIMLDRGKVKGIGNYRFAILEITDEAPDDGNRRIIFIREWEGNNDDVTQGDVNYYELEAFRLTDLKRDDCWIKVFVRGNSVIVRTQALGYGTSKFWISNIHDIVHHLKFAEKPKKSKKGGTYKFTVNGCFFGEYPGSKIVVEIKGYEDISEVQFLSYFDEDDQRRSIFSLSYSKFLEGMKKVQEIMMINMAIM